MTDFAARLKQVATNPKTFSQFGRGVERETLRYTEDGHLATGPHPKALGSALMNERVTTDFSESLLEFITPVSNDVPTLLNQLSDIHHFTQTKLDGEKLWPLSMPCYVGSEDYIQLAQYGTSNNGKMKTLYREGLKRRYGSLMQIISGVHFNFSFPESFWDSLFGEQTEQEALEMALSTWPKMIIPVVHYAESRSVEYDNPKIKPQAHSDYVINPFNDYGHCIDVMIEAKHKELALLRYRDILNQKEAV